MCHSAEGDTARGRVARKQGMVEIKSCFQLHQPSYAVKGSILCQDKHYILEECGAMFAWSGCVEEKTVGGVGYNREGLVSGYPSQNIDVSLDVCF